MIKCPNKNDPKWKVLVDALGEKRAYQAYFRHKAGGEIPTVEVGHSLLGGKTPLASSTGPGAAAAGEPGTYAPIQQLADRMRASVPKDAAVTEKFDAIGQIKQAYGKIRERVSDGLANLQAAKDVFVDSLKADQPFTDAKKAAGEWFYALQKNASFVRQFADDLKERVPSKLRREAITNWIQADGDEAVLAERAEKSSNKLRPGYETALKLTAEEKTIAMQIKDYFDQQLERGQEEGILANGVEDYVNQIWKDSDNPTATALKNELSNPKLNTNFRYARKRIFDSYFEGEQAGYEPADKDIGALLASYDQSFSRTLASRAYIKSLLKAKAEDGRPVAVPAGGGTIVETPTDTKAYIKPTLKPEEMSDYRTIDHPAMRKWKQVARTPLGTEAYVEGQLLIHPKEYAAIKNRLSQSAVRSNPVGRMALQAGSELKSTLLSVSGFHQVQEALHALGHKVNLTDLEKIDVENPETASLMKHGLQLVDYNGEESFLEGLTGGGSGLLSKVPGLGKVLQRYNEYLFQDLIPRLKLTMAKEALARNRKRYAGKLTNDQIQELTARQANVAFGELPYEYWGRNKTLQDVLRLTLLAPDFLESRGRFVGQAIKPYGREQLAAIGTLAASQYIIARVANQILDDDPHWELKHLFDIVYKGHTYNLRTIPTDIAHLFNDTRGFVYNRLSILMRAVVEGITGRDDRGVKRNAWQQVKDFASNVIPITVKQRDDQNIWESALSAFAVNTRRYSADREISEVARDWKKQNAKSSPEIVYNADADVYRPLRLAIEDRDSKKTLDALNEIEKTVPRGKAIHHVIVYYGRPFTGSRANDIKFEKSLTGTEKKTLQKAREERRQAKAFFESVIQKSPP
jgi:hypothetical protein